MTTSPYYPEANGFIERTVQTVKNLLQKCKESGADPHLAMLCLRSTPHDQNIASPADLLNSRVYQANLPSISKPVLSLSADGEVNTKLQARQDQHKSQYDRSSKLLLLYIRTTQRVYLTHTITSGNLVLSSVARRLLVHIRSPWQMTVPSGETAATFGQQKRKFVSRATTPVMNHQHP